MSESLYEPCPLCHNHRVDRDACRGCGGDGFVAVGLSAAQVEAHAGDAKRLHLAAACRITLTAPGEPGGYWQASVSGGAPASEDGTAARIGKTPREAMDALIRRLGL